MLRGGLVQSRSGTTNLSSLVFQDEVPYLTFLSKRSGVRVKLILSSLPLLAE
jgi:hypothetical protein